MARPIVVVAGVIERDGRFLVTRRQAGVHLEGYWEFPGGKCDAGESHAACLERELGEELGVTTAVAGHLLSVQQPYEDRTIELHFYACEIEGMPAPLVGQEIRWATRAELGALRFPPADAELIAMLRGGGAPAEGAENAETK